MSALVTTVAGSGNAAFADGSGASASFNEPEVLAVDDKGMIFVGDTFNNRIRRIAPDRAVTTFAGSGENPSGLGAFADGPASVAGFFRPRGIAVAAGVVYIGDNGNHAVRKATTSGAVTTLVGSPSSAGYADGPVSMAKFFYPSGLALKPDGTVCVADRNNDRVRQITPAGIVSTIAGNGTRGYADGPGASASFSRSSAIVGPRDPRGRSRAAA